ncbi:MAG: 3-deoxy-D-manno-octulosonic acid transferase, partial [Bacteroidales bacterium]|nr:3-deoxy-D-manno-octulosonic acid transferase [Bacteroidales bacterium]
MRIIYNIGIHLYDFLIFIYSFFNEKARLLYNGRKGWYEKLKQSVVPGEKYFWTHCASLGEFEQGRP